MASAATQFTPNPLSNIPEFRANSTTPNTQLPSSKQVALDLITQIKLILRDTTNPQIVGQITSITPLKNIETSIPEHISKLLSSALEENETNGKNRTYEETLKNKLKEQYPTTLKEFLQNHKIPTTINILIDNNVFIENRSAFVRLYLQPLKIALSTIKQNINDSGESKNTDFIIKSLELLGTITEKIFSVLNHDLSQNSISKAKFSKNSVEYNNTNKETILSNIKNAINSLNATKTFPYQTSQVPTAYNQNPPSINQRPDKEIIDELLSYGPYNINNPGDLLNFHTSNTLIYNRLSPGARNMPGEVYGEQLTAISNPNQITPSPMYTAEHNPATEYFTNQPGPWTNNIASYYLENPGALASLPRSQFEVLLNTCQGNTAQYTEQHEEDISNHQAASLQPAAKRNRTGTSFPRHPDYFRYTSADFLPFN